MADIKPTGTGAPATEPPVKRGKPSRDVSADGKQAQVDEAKDEGASKKSVPVDEMTTANDK